MHRLFWKLFLSYWAVLVLFAAAVVVSSSIYIDWLRGHRDSEPPYAQYSRELADARVSAERGGVEGLREWLKRTDSAELVPVLLIDAQGRDLLGREVSPRALDFVQRMINRDAQSGHPRALIRTPDGAEYRLLRDFQNVTFSRLIGRPRVIALPLVLAALGGGLICFLLARYLVAPIEGLTRATEDFARGHLDRRVAPALGRRKDEIADLARAMDHMAERLATLIGVQQQLLRDISHELRSPLTRLQATLELARRRQGDDPAFDRIEREAQRLNELIGRILSLARLDAGAHPLRLEQVSLEELIREVAEDAEFEAKDRGVGLVPTLHCAGRLEGDANLLRSAIENIVLNALKYAPEGTEVGVSLTETSARHYRVSVTDSGPGVPEDMLASIFHPFVRVQGSGNPQGFGLGLAIADRAVRLHEGTVFACNRPTGGLEVVIELGAR